MKEFDPRRTARGLIAPAVLTVSVIGFGACGGKGEVSNHPDNTLQNQPTATVQVETPIPTIEASPTPEQKMLTPEELKNTADKISGLIDQGFTSVSLDPKQVPEYEYSHPELIKAQLQNCISFGNSLNVFDGPGKTRLVESSDPNYLSTLFGQCTGVGEATKWLWQTTGKEAFFQANQEMKDVHETVFRIEQERTPGVLEESYWTRRVAEDYTLR